MSDSTHIECPAAIFCGGEHLRLGRLGGAQAKTLLVTRDIPLLWRLIDHLTAAGFSRIVAATTPRLERQIAGSVDDYLRTGRIDADIEVVATAEQQRGLIFGLARLLETWTAERCLICLGDMFFLGNPFPAFRPHVEANYDCLGVAPAKLEEDRRLGGLVYEEANRVRSIVERPVGEIVGTPLRWSGTALFARRPALEGMEDFAAASGDDRPPGDFFEFQRQRGRDMRCVLGPDFVNVNSPDQLLLASLYAGLEDVSAGQGGRQDGRGFLSSRLSEAAQALRRDIARRARPDRC